MQVFTNEFQEKALSLLTSDWQRLPALRLKLDTSADVWRELRDIGKIEEKIESLKRNSLDGGCYIYYRLKEGKK